MSEIITDKLTGRTTDGNITVTSEGGAATQSLQQGLCKAWSHFTGGFAIADSFNIGSVTDNGTGRPEFNFTNNMGNTTYSAAGHTYARMIGAHDTDGNFTASSAAMSIFTHAGSLSDVASSQIAGVNYFGDLA